MPLSDLDHLWGNDLGVTPTGDINVVSGADRTIQRVIRRLMTVPTNQTGSSYPWHPTYGVGLGVRIGQPVDVRGLQAVVLSQLLLEPTVARIPLPTIDVQLLGSSGTITINITYIDKSGTPQGFSFNLSS